MRFLNIIRSRWRAVTARGQVDVEMSEEMRLHLEQRIQESIAAGLSAEEARHAAMRKFGGIEQVKERCREQRFGAWLESTGRDLRFSVRSLRRSPVFCVTAIVTLALCIGANTTILSTLYSLLLKPLPFPEPEQLVEVYNVYPKAGVLKLPVSVGQYQHYKVSADLFEDFALWTNWAFTIGENGNPTRETGARVSADLFKLARAQPLLGRFFTLEEGAPGRDTVLVLSESYWRTRYGSDPDVIGAEVRLSGEAFTIIGVAPRNLEVLNGNVVFLRPLHVSAPQLADARHNYSAKMFARIKSGVPLATAAAQLATLERRYFEETSDADMRMLRELTGHQIALARIRTEQAKPVANGLILLQGAALVVLLLGAVNVTNLMLARANSRQVEFAIRHALGAGRGTLASQLLMESMLLAGLGAAIGVALSWTSLRIINAFKAEIVPTAPHVSLDGTVLMVMVLVTLLVAVFVGMIPLVRVWRVSVNGPIQRNSRNASAARSLRIASGSLITAQVALGLVLSIGALLLIQSYARVLAVDPDFDAAKFLHARVALDASYKRFLNVKSAQDRIIAAMREIAGVEAVCIMPGDPIKGLFGPAIFRIRAQIAGGEESAPTAWHLVVSPDFFETMGIRIIEGRGFTKADSERSDPVHIVDRNFAEKYFPGRSAIGERFIPAGPDRSPDRWPVIVGVVEAVRFTGLEDREQRPFVYTAEFSDFSPRVFSIVLRTERQVAEMMTLMRAALNRIDPALPLYNVKTLSLAFDDLLDTRRGIMALLGVFALIALILSAVGTYGALAYDVSQRTREVGIRSAMGATRRQIIMMILGHGLRRAGLGVIIGIGTALGLTQFLRGQLFQISSNDPATFLAAALILLAVAAFASWLPARRAAKVDPIVALRSE